jgi:hypothetical protein
MALLQQENIVLMDELTKERGHVNQFFIAAEWPAERESKIVSGECPVERKNKYTITELQTIDKTCLVLLLARQFIGSVYFVVMNLFVWCLLLAGGVNFVVMSAIRFHLIMLIWFNLFRIELGILTILNQFYWCFAGPFYRCFARRTFLSNDSETACFLLLVTKCCKNYLL